MTFVIVLYNDVSYLVIAKSNGYQKKKEEENKTLPSRVSCLSMFPCPMPSTRHGTTVYVLMIRLVMQKRKIYRFQYINVDG